MQGNGGCFQESSQVFVHPLKFQCEIPVIVLAGANCFLGLFTLGYVPQNEQNQGGTFAR